MAAPRFSWLRLALIGVFVMGVFPYLIYLIGTWIVPLTAPFFLAWIGWILCVCIWRSRKGWKPPAK